MKKPRTAAQLEASRRNGAQSHGPVTDNGKAASSRNATTHGLRSTRLVATGEDADELNKLRVHWMRQLQPQTEAERDAAEQVVTALWQQRRCENAEIAILDDEIERLGEAGPRAVGRAIKSLVETSPALALVLRYKNTARRDYERAVKFYHELVDRRRAEEQRDANSLDEKDYQTKWGARPGERVQGYYGSTKDRELLPNEPTTVFPIVLPAPSNALQPEALPA